MHALDCNVHAKTAATQLWRGGFSQPTKESLDSHVAYIHWSTACYEESLSIFLHLCDKRGTDCRTPALDEHTGHVCHAASVTISGLFSSLSPGMRQSTCACILTAIHRTCGLILGPTSATRTSQSMLRLMLGLPFTPTRQCSLEWLSQCPVRPVLIRRCSWLVFTQMSSSTRL